MNDPWMLPVYGSDGPLDATHVPNQTLMYCGPSFVEMLSGKKTGIKFKMSYIDFWF